MNLPIIITNVSSTNVIIIIKSFENNNRVETWMNIE